MHQVALPFNTRQIDRNRLKILLEPSIPDEHVECSSLNTWLDITTPRIPARITNRLRASSQRFCRSSSHALCAIASDIPFRRASSPKEIDELAGIWEPSWMTAAEESSTISSAAHCPNASETPLIPLGGHNSTSWDKINDDPSHPFWVSPGIAKKICTDSTSVAETEVVLFELGRLPTEVQYGLLSFMLTSPSGIVNPWEDDTDQTRAWSRYLRPNIIATCKDLYKIGTGLLYEVNDFHFTRKASLINGIEADPQTIQSFLSYRHGLRRALDFPNTTVVRGQLIRKILLCPGCYGIEDSNGTPAALNEPKYLVHAWQFNTLRHLEFVGCHLNQLTISFDDASEFLSHHLRFESEMRAIGTLGDRITMFPVEEISQRETAWRTLQSNYGWRNGLVEQPWPLEYAFRKSPYGCWAESVFGLHADKLYIRGISASGSSLRKYNFSGRELPTTSLARQVVAWLGQTGINYLTLEFTGAYDCR